MYMSFGFDVIDHYMLTCLGLGQGFNTFACPSHVERVLQGCHLQLARPTVVAAGTWTQSWSRPGVRMSIAILHVAARSSREESVMYRAEAEPQ